jgi:hypothetical protein
MHGQMNVKKYMKEHPKKLGCIFRHEGGLLWRNILMFHGRQVMYCAYSILADSCGMLSEARGQKRFDPAACTSHYHGLRTQTWNGSYILTNLVVD